MAWREGNKTMGQIVYYGAGKNLHDHEKEFIAETGYPVCICDASKKKQQTAYVFEEGRECKIYSLDYVKEHFPDYE